MADATVRNPAFEIETAEVSSLVEYALNSKEHPAEQIETLKYSLSKFGQTVPIVVDARNVVVAGHGRLIAMKELGIERCAVVRVPEWTEEMAKEYRILDNRSNESPWNWKNLQIDLSSAKMPELSLLFPDITVGPLDVPNGLAAPLPNSAPEPENDFRDPVASI